MKINCKVEHYEYKNRVRNLTTEAKGVVKSEKFFPVYLKNGKEEIFKPISKTILKMHRKFKEAFH